MSESDSTSAVQARTDVVALLDLIAAEGTRTAVTDVTLAHTDVPAALSPFSYVAPADLVLFLGITVLLLASGVVESRRLGLLRRLAAAPVRRRSVVAALVATSLCVAAAQCAGLLVVGRLIFGVHWGNPAGVFLVLAMLSLAYAGAAALVEPAHAHRGAGDLGRRRARHRGRDARRLHVPPGRRRAGGPRRRPRRPAGVGHGRVREADLRPRRPDGGAARGRGAGPVRRCAVALALRAYARTVYSPG